LGPFGRTGQHDELLSKSKIFENQFLASLEDREKGFHGQLEYNNHGRQECLGCSEIFKYFNADELMEGTGNK